MICINCANEHFENFCPNCGEPGTVPKITFRSILNDFSSSVISMDKGFLYVVKNLFLNPRKVVIDYILGKRKNTFNPVSFLIIMVSIYLIVDSFITIPSGGTKERSEYYSIGYEAGKFIRVNLKYFWILSIIWLSISTKMIFQRFNFAEHLAINSFVIGQSTLVGLIGLILFKFPILFDPFIYGSIIWMLFQIFKEPHSSKGELLLQSFGSTLLFFVQQFLIVVLIALILWLIKT